MKAQFLEHLKSAADYSLNLFNKELEPITLYEAKSERAILQILIENYFWKLYNNKNRFPYYPLREKDRRVDLIFYDQITNKPVTAVEIKHQFAYDLYKKAGKQTKFELAISDDSDNLRKKFESCSKFYLHFLSHLEKHQKDIYDNQATRKSLRYLSGDKGKWLEFYSAIHNSSELNEKIRILCKKPGFSEPFISKDYTSKINVPSKEGNTVPIEISTKFIVVEIY